MLQLQTEDQLQPLILAHGVWHPKVPKMAFVPWFVIGRTLGGEDAIVMGEKGRAGWF